MKSISAIHPAITEITENILVKRTPNILIREAIPCLPQIVTLRGCEEKNGRSKGYKGSTLMQAL